MYALQSLAIRGHGGNVLCSEPRHTLHVVICNKIRRKAALVVLNDLFELSLGIVTRSSSVAPETSKSRNSELHMRE